MTFYRVEHKVYLTDLGADTKIYPQSVAVTYQVNAVPMAKVDLAFGEGFEPNDTAELEQQLEILRDWEESRAMLVIEVERTQTNTENGDREFTYEEIFMGYLHAPSNQMVRQGASYSFVLQTERS